MKVKLIAGLMLFLSFGISAQKSTIVTTQSNYQKQWEKVDEIQKDDLPKSALLVVDGILNTAIKEGNTQQVIKALIYKNKFNLEISKDNDNQIFADLEDLLMKTTNVADESLLHSMLAQLYLDYMNDHLWEINQRTALVDYVPKDMKEWSRNIFERKALSHLTESVHNQNELLAIRTKSYSDIINIGVDSERLFPTLYDFLMDRAIDQSAVFTSNNDQNIAFAKSLDAKSISIENLALPVSGFLKLNFSDNVNLVTLQYYQNFLKSLSQRGLNESLVLTDIKRNDYLSGQSENYSTKYAMDFLLKLEKENTQYDYNVEIISAIINRLQYSNSLRGYVNSENTNKTKEIYDWCKLGIEKYPNYERINILKQRLAEIERPFANISAPEVYHPDNKDKKVKINYKNLKGITIKLIDDSTNKLVYSQKIELKHPNTYSSQESEFVLNLNKVGSYELKLESELKGQNKSFKIVISELASFARKAGENEYEFYIVDRLTGKPIEDADITVFSTTWNSKEHNQLTKLKTDSRGIASFDSKNFPFKGKDSKYVYKVTKGEDAFLGYKAFPYYYNYTSPARADKNFASIFTDRSIYRPGQTVYFKAVSINQENVQIARPNTNSELKIELRNENDEVVAEKALRTNEFGSVAGEFILPKGGLNGQYRIVVGNTSEYFSVEEYKRPTFQITFDKLDKTYTSGDQVKLIGHAESFSGIKLQGATVNYSVVQSSFLRWFNSSSETVADGVVTTQDDGSFTIDFSIPQNDKKKMWFNSIYNYEVEATITDQNGETQKGSFNFAVGDASMYLETNISDKLDKNSSDKIQITAKNLNGEKISVKGTYTLSSLLPNDSIKVQVSKGNFETNTDSDLLSQIKRLSSAKYRLQLTAKDDKNRDVNYQVDFILYAWDDKKPPIVTNEWIVQKQTEFNESQPAEILIGVSAKEATVLYDLIQGEKLLSREQFKLSDSNKRLLIPYKSEYGENVTASFTYVIDEVPYTQQITLNKKNESKELKLKLDVFRDKLRPGQEEQWSISVKDNKDKPVFAELLASMYDSSLDQLRSENVWRLAKMTARYAYPSLFTTPSFQSESAYLSFPSINNYEFKSFEWDHLNWFGFSFKQPLFGNMRIRGAATLSASDLQVADNGYLLAENAVVASPRAKSTAKEEKEKSVTTTPQIRSNFNETAFFYPQLKTNENGETIIRFTVPESNTTWKFRALAYDKEINTGSLEAIAISRKELMVTPNLPRFVRQGDKTGISTKISNLSEEALAGKVRIEFFDPLTDKTIDFSIFNQIQDFSLEKDASSSVTWLFDVPSGVDIIGVRIVAETASFSDGEQHVLPVLPNRMLVTESTTMNINGKQTKDFSFDKYINNNSQTLSNYRLTLEYSNNPAWYAVQALPVLSNPTNENAVNWFASYYVNTLGMYINSQYPKVANMIKTWKQQGGDKETLVSNLQKNEELKSILLEETPWVLDAKNETQQMDRLSLLFDLNNSKMQASQAISKLKDLQNADGGWSWYKGMYSSRSITQYVLYGFTQLINIGVVEYSSEIKEMQISALKFIDSQIKKDYEYLKKDTRDWKALKQISTNQLEYIYVRSAYRDIPVDSSTREAERFYTSVAEKYWTSLNLYERSLLSVIASRNGNKQLTNKVMASLRERATTNDEMGMFWANNTNRVFFSQSAMAVHTFLMEAFRETNAPIAEMDQMKQWLLKQKQTQIWESTHATIDAIYALLSTGSNWFDGDGASQVIVDNQVLSPEAKELGTGYIQKSWTADQMTKDLGKVQIKKTGEGPAWGAMYWQYYEDLDKITKQSGELNIDKKLFVEKSTDKGKVLVEVNENNPLKVGDKVTIRLTARLDRDMEFVSIKDMRASCFEPIDVLSGLRWQNGAYYYQSTKDASTNFYFDQLSKGTYVFEYSTYVNRVGEYSSGISTIQCSYAPEFVSHTAGSKIEVK